VRGRSSTPWKPPTSGSTLTACRWHTRAGRSLEVRQVGKILELHQELPGRIHIVLIRQKVSF
jgi:hypothetical protein